MKRSLASVNRKHSLVRRMTIVMLWNWVQLSVNGYSFLNFSAGRKSVRTYHRQKPSRRFRHSKTSYPRIRSICHATASEKEVEHKTCRDELDGDISHLSDTTHFSRRRALQAMALASVALPSAAIAGVPEYDISTGSLYSPKAEMLRGGSTAARGIVVDSKGSHLKPGQALQTVYDTRFIAYLARFLLTIDPSASAWWLKEDGAGPAEERFAEFAESVEVGLADYFVGPYGSYSSIKAAAAGIRASVQVKSARAKDRQGIFESVRNSFTGAKEKEQRLRESNKIAKQGILNLYTLLKARYTSVEAKKQLAILFSFFSEPDLQPTTEIRSLFGEIDNATISEIDVIKPISSSEATSRSSGRRGGGYTLTNPPEVLVDPPPALGSSYKAAKVTPIMKPTSRILRIRLIDGGSGYTQAPTVTVTGFSERQCSACAILDRDGHVESIVVLDPGYGYRSKGQSSPKVKISGPRKLENGSEKVRTARAALDLEYEVIGVVITEGGNGFVLTEPPKVVITPPKDDPDWYVQNPESAMLESEFGAFRAEVISMKDKNGILDYAAGTFRPPTTIPFDRIQNMPLTLLPSSVRPELNSYGKYVIPEIAAIQTYSTSPNPRFRAVDPLFGAIGKVPVTKSAAELKADEYGRLAASGAFCTVLVRTALNPLELIKTKLQLQNDEELLQFAQDNLKTSGINAALEEDDSIVETIIEENKIGTVDLIKNLVALRGPRALFQSADITFLASLVFGSFGFGATELFRRSFTMTFFTDGGGTNSEVILLLAATAATVITSAAASPFELLRVRSMGLIESKPWTAVLGDFLNEKASNRGGKKSKKSVSTPEKSSDFSLKDIKAKDLLPLFAGFPPTVSRELAFAIPKFLVFDIISKAITGFINGSADPGSLPIQVGVGTEGLTISAFSGALAGIAGAIVSHPADLILTKTSASAKKQSDDGPDTDWRDVVKDLLSKEGGFANLYIGLQPRLVFFFLVIGLQFFLYDYVKVLLMVGSDDLSLVLDVFYAVRQGLVETTGSPLQ